MSTTITGSAATTASTAADLDLVDPDTVIMPLPMDSAEALQDFAATAPAISIEQEPSPVTAAPPAPEPAAAAPAAEPKGWFFKRTHSKEAKDCKIRWSPTSPSLLEQAESRILSYVKTPYHGQYVNVGTGAKTGGSASKCRWSHQKPEERKIWTVVYNPESKGTPLVMVHGLCAALGLWAMNVDELAKNRPVYTIDLLGFGRSSRPNLGKDAMEAELSHVEAIEEWRKSMGLEKFVLLGHSMGGFISAGYALRYPDNLEHLILADPWGFPKRPDGALEAIIESSGRPKTVKLIAAVGQRVNALGLMRAAGPLGPGLVDKMRPDLVRKFEPLSNGSGAAGDGNGNGVGSVGQYIYHCNAQKPTGEDAFRTMMDLMGWAKNSMAPRIQDLNPKVPMSLIYGGSTWLQHATEDELKASRPANAYTKVHILPDAGHHVYVDSMKLFNRIVNNICEGVGGAFGRN